MDFDFKRLSEVKFYRDFKDVILDEELSPMVKLVYAWQQNTGKFLEHTPKEYLDYFLSNLKECGSCKRYRAILVKDGEVEKPLREYVSSSSNIDVCRNIFKGYVTTPYTRKIYEITGESELDVAPYRDMAEEEYIIYKPKIVRLVEEVVVIKDTKEVSDTANIFYSLASYMKTLIPESKWNKLSGDNMYEKLYQYIIEQRLDRKR